MFNSPFQCPVWFLGRNFFKIGLCLNGWKCLWADWAGMADGTPWKEFLHHLSLQPSIFTWAAPDFSVSLHRAVKWDGYSPGSGAAPGDGICKDEETLIRTNSPWLAKAPSERIHRDSNNKRHLELSVMRQSHNAHFISYCLFLTKLQGAGKNTVRKKFSPQCSDICIFSPKAFATGSHWRQDAVLYGLLMQVDCFPAFKYFRAGFWPDLLGPIRR